MCYAGSAVSTSKAGKPVGFGREPWLEEVEGGIVGGWCVLAEAGPDVPHLAGSLAAHRRHLWRPA